MMHFPISGVETYWWLPMLVAFGISCLTSMGGISGAFLILPFQISVLGFVTPAVSSTNLIYNLISIPSGVYRYIRESRMLWPLVLLTTLGSIPGLLIGVIIRIKYLPDPTAFKLFAGIVLLYIGIRLIPDIIRSRFSKAADKNKTNFIIESTKCNFKKLSYKFAGKDHTLPSMFILLISFLVGIVGGIYGVGGGAFIAPVLVAVFRLPVHSIAGAALTGTFLSSLIGVLFYIFIAPLFVTNELTVHPDYLLGLMFGIGGAFGMYVGARLQRFIPARIIKLILFVCVIFISVKYIVGFFG